MARELDLYFGGTLNNMYSRIYRDTATPEFRIQSLLTGQALRISSIDDIHLDSGSSKNVIIDDIANYGSSGYDGVVVQKDGKLYFRTLTEIGGGLGISLTQYKIPRAATTTTLGDGPFLCSADNSTVGLADNIKLTFGTHIDSSIMDNNTNMVFTRETSGNFLFTGGWIGINESPTGAALQVTGTTAVNGNNALFRKSGRTIGYYVYNYSDANGDSAATGMNLTLNSSGSFVRQSTDEEGWCTTQSCRTGATTYTIWYSNAAGTVVDRLNISENGNIGVGNQNDTYRLDVTGTGRFQGTSGAPVTSGSTQTYLGLRVWADSTLDTGIDMGSHGGYGANGICSWIQSVNVANLATAETLTINPNGATVNIGGTYTEKQSGLSLAIADDCWCKGDLVINSNTPITGYNLENHGNQLNYFLDDDTDNIAYLLTLNHQSTGTVTNGQFGTGIKFVFEATGHAPPTEYNLWATTTGFEIDASLHATGFSCDTASGLAWPSDHSYIKEVLPNYGLEIKSSHEISLTGDYVVASGYVLQQGIFAGIHVHDASAAQTIATGTTYTKLTCFAADGQSANCTPDYANDKITITKAGRYFVGFTLSATAGTVNLTWRVAAFLNGAEQDHIHAKHKIATTGDSVSVAGMGFIDVTTVPWDLDLRVRHSGGSDADLTVEYSNLTCQYVGAT